MTDWHSSKILFVLLIVASLSTALFFIPQAVLGKRVPMGHPSLSASLSAGPDPDFDYVLVKDEQAVETLKADVGTKLYGMVSTVILPEVRKEFDEKRNIYSDSYVEGVWGHYDLHDSKLDILIGRVPPEYGCNTESCAHRVVNVDVPAEHRPSYIRQVYFSIAVYEDMARDRHYDDLVERIMNKASAEAKILFSEGANVLEDNRQALLEDDTAIEELVLRQYEDISRISVIFLSFESGKPSAKKPLDVVITSNSYYERSWSLSLQSGQQEDLQPTPEMMQECEKIGIDPDKCSDPAILRKRIEGSTTAAIDSEFLARQQSAMNNSLLLVGIGAAAAAIAGFVTLKKLR